MPSSTAWRRPFRDPHVRYQSPARPPDDAIEPLTPNRSPSPQYSTIEHNWVDGPNNLQLTRGLGLLFESGPNAATESTPTHQLWVDQNGEARVDAFVTPPTNLHPSLVNGDRPSSRKESDRKRDRLKGGHVRSASTMDALAEIALATSPTFTHGSASLVQSPWPTIPYNNGYDYTTEERPAKRARSERLPSPNVMRTASRPATSHANLDENMRSDAELLLNFAKPQNFPTLTTPPIHHITLRSPSFKRLSESSSSGSESPVLQPAAAAVNLSVQETFKTLETFDEKNIVHSPDVLEGPLWTVPKDHQDPVQTDSQPAEADEPPAPTEDSSAKDPGEFTRPANEKLDLEQSTTEGDLPPEEDVVAEERKPRRIKPTTQVTSCSGCNLLQSTATGGDSEDSPTLWICCNVCKGWFHFACAGFKDKREAQAVDKYICSGCEPEHGETTFVRKSSRARTAIDYAGLNQGIVKSSAETPEHHYIQPIKEGKITFQPDEFARVRPELVTSDYFDKTDGMKRPIVIPACWNPRFGARPPTADTSGDQQVGAETETQPGSPSIGGSEEAIPEEFDSEEVIDCSQDLLDMVMPQDLTVRTVSELYGPEERVEVIDVKSQSQGDRKWTMRKWADYYESTEEKVVRNVISLEVSQSKLGRLIRRPKIVRDLDLQDSVWPAELQAIGDFPKVQFYCLMSVADCYTDFHIDFGGSSVYYHILKGKKTFFFIPPEDKNLKKYEEWCNSDTQDTTFLGDVTGECSRVDLSEGDTMLIPAGWIHAVWTPENSLVIGGNFLTRMNYEMQIRVANIERDTKVARKFRYPFFQKIMWFTAIKYLEDDPLPQEVLDDFYSDHEFVFRRANPTWHEFGELENNKEPGDKDFHIRFYSRKEIEGLPALRDYLYRTALIAGGFHVNGNVTVEASRNVKRSIPKSCGDPLEFIKTFGIWCAWKIGSAVAPEWTRPDSRSTTKLIEKQERLKKPDVARTPPERSSTRVALQAETARASLEANASPLKRSVSSAGYESDDGQKPQSTPKTSGLGPKRVACDPCRKRRIRCRHKEDGDTPTASSSEVRPRGYSNISVEVSRPPLALGLASLDGASSPERHYPEPSIENFSSPVISQLETIDPSLQTLPSRAQDLSTPLVSSSNKKGRSKACDECRKSKRRCIHDEFGRVDPAKAAEPSKPRGTTSTKRPPRTSDERRPSTAKRPKTEASGPDTEIETLLVGQAQSALAEVFNEQDDQSSQVDFNSLIDPALMQDTHLIQPTTLLAFSESVEQMPTATDAIQETTPEVTAAPNEQEASTAMSDAQNTAASSEQQEQVQGAQLDDDAQSRYSMKMEPAAVSLIINSGQTSAASLVSPPDSLLNDTDLSPIAVVGGGFTASIEGIGDNSDSSLNPLHTPSSASRHSSRQPKQIDRYVPDAPSTSVKPAPKPAPYDRRASSSGISALTDLDTKSRRSSSNRSTGVSGGGGRAKAPTAPPRSGKGGSPASQVERARRGRSSFEGHTDEESLKLIRALQEEEFGLRRRSTRG